MKLGWWTETERTCELRNEVEADAAHHIELLNVTAWTALGGVRGILCIYICAVVGCGEGDVYEKTVWCLRCASE